MDERIRILGGILKRIDNFRMDSLDSRIVFQKTVYFLQVFGIRLNYDFSWYHYGPYCPLLVRDGFVLKENIKSMDAVCFENKELEVKFNNFINFLGKGKNDYVWLEALASVHFLRNAYPALKKEDILRVVKDKQPYLNSGTIVEDAWYFLEAFNLI